MNMEKAGPRWWAKALSYWSILNLYFVLGAAPAAAAPTSVLCRDGSYRRAHPLICDTGMGAPGQFPGSGGNVGGGHGGLLDFLGHLGGLL